MKQKLAPISSHLIAEAAEWLVEIQEGQLNAEQQQKFEQWKNQSAEHQRAWQQAEQLQHYLNDVPDNVSEQIFDDHQHKKLNGKFLSIILLTAGAAITAYYAQQQAWLADQRTAYGEQRSVILEDGSKLILNSKTAIDIDFSATERNIKLHYGEIFIQTAKDQQQRPRPFKVLNQDGSILALGTQFNVAQQENQTQVAVLEHAVLIENKSGQKYQLGAGEQTQFDKQHIGTNYSINTLDFAWHHHLIVADRISLTHFSQQIEKHYGYSVEIDPTLKDLIISGTYPSNDLNALIQAFGQAYDLKIEQKTFPRKIIISQ